MSFRISWRPQQTAACFEVCGEIANHLDSIMRYVKTKAVGRPSLLLDIRGATKRPLADKLFIHVLKYPPGFRQRIALVDLKEHGAFCSLYARLVRSRGYQVRFFGDVDVANEWLRGGDLPPKASRSRVFCQGLTLLRHSFNPIRLLHATTTSL